MLWAQSPSFLHVLLLIFVILRGRKNKTAVVTFGEADWQWLAGRMKHLPLARARASARARSMGDIAPPNATSLCKEHRRHSRRRQKSYFARPCPTPTYNYNNMLASFNGFKPWSQVPCITARGYPKTLLLSSALCLPLRNQQGLSPNKNRKLSVITPVVLYPWILIVLACSCHYSYADNDKLMTKLLARVPL